MAEKELTIYCHCAGYDLAPKDVKSGVLNALRAGAGHVIEVADLCRLSADKDARLRDWASAERIRIFACYPRTVRWLFSAAGAPLPDSPVEYHNMRADDFRLQTSDYRLQEPQARSLRPEICSLEPEARGSTWVPWFPVIDYDRCTNCGQCLNFCLFGVYGRSEDGRVEVASPANCKTHCPACARVCPRAAIIFPKHGESPINGDAIDEQALAAHKEKAR
ncbi:MAG TPA: ferredoxin family protein, partial [Phycisphaerales bacterium]|nr:ferredoxin family protein [Phycisphaerales bacterium]